MTQNEIYIGNNIKCCKGRVICGVATHLPLLFMVIILGLLIFTIWNVFIFPYYLYSLDRKYLSIPIIFYFSSLGTLYHLVKCFITEPGIIPRGYYLYTKENVQMADKPDKTVDSSSGNINSATFLDSMSSSKANESNKPRIYTERYCYTCDIVRPPKVSHCHFCDNCVIGFDQ